MSKEEFLAELREALVEEVPVETINENIKYYDEYISSKGGKEEQEKEISNIGDPRLIARTIIEGYKMSNEYKYTGGRENTSNYTYSEYRQESNGQNSSYHVNETTKKSSINDALSTAKRVAIILAVVLVLFVVLRFAISLFFSIVLPAALIYLAVRYIMRLFHDK